MEQGDQVIPYPQRSYTVQQLMGSGIPLMTTPLGQTNNINTVMSTTYYIEGDNIPGSEGYGKRKTDQIGSIFCQTNPLGYVMLDWATFKDTGVQTEDIKQNKEPERDYIKY